MAVTAPPKGGAAPLVRLVEWDAPDGSPRQTQAARPRLTVVPFLGATKVARVVPARRREAETGEVAPTVVSAPSHSVLRL